MSAAEVEDLLRKEATNSYGIMAPSGPQVFASHHVTRNSAIQVEMGFGLVFCLVPAVLI